MSSNFTVSVVIPTYNGAEFVHAAINSVLNQTRPADEIIISDDNSTDDTLQICEKFGKKIKIFRNQEGPSGFVNGWNNAISHASCHYVSILHQDDMLHPTFLEEIEKAYFMHPDVKHFFTTCSIINEKDNIIRTQSNYNSGIIHRFTGQQYALAYERVKGHIHRCPGVVTHREIFKICKYRAEAGHIADDDFFLRVGNYTDIVGILRPLSYYREHKSSETGHLSFLNLNLRLLNDYHFQLLNYKNNPLLSEEIINIFKHWETMYSHRVILFGIRRFKFNYVIKGLSKWLDFNNQFGNLSYDIGKIPNLLKNYIRKKHLDYLVQKSRHCNYLDRKTEKKIIIIAPHPEDEVLGCGGLITRMTASGSPPHIIVLTGGERSLGSESGIKEVEIKKARRNLTRKALTELGLPMENLHEFNLADGHIGESTEEQLNEVRECIIGLNPDMLLVPHWGEGWPDHINVSKLFTKGLPNNCEVWEYCVWMWYYNVWRGLDWKNASVLRLTKEEQSLKNRAIDEYVLPLSPIGRPWSGDLPPIFLKAARGPVELYFKCQ